MTSTSPKRRTRIARIAGLIVLMGVGMVVWGNWETVMALHYGRKLTSNNPFERHQALVSLQDYKGGAKAIQSELISLLDEEALHINVIAASILDAIEDLPPDLQERIDKIQMDNINELKDNFNELLEAISD